MFQPGPLGRQAITISPWSPHAQTFIYTNKWGLTVTSGQWPAAGTVLFMPFFLDAAVTVMKAWWYNGSAVAGNLDLGVYRPDGSRIVSIGTTAQAGTTAVQTADIADTVLGRGQYYLALVSDTAGASSLIAGVSAVSSGGMQALGFLEQAGVTLPLSTGASPATFAKHGSARVLVPVYGLQGYRSLGPT